MHFSDYLTLSIIFVTIIGIAIGRFPLFRMNRATIALVGTAALIGVGSIKLDDAYNAIDMNTIVLLFSMMVINVNLRLSGFFNIIVIHFLRIANTPNRLLVLIVFSSGFLSSLFLNDTIVIIFTPIVVEITLALKRNPVPYLIALAASANAGSVATIVGNPQNMIIGVASGIPFAQFTLHMLPSAIAGLCIIILLIRIIYKKEFSVQFIQRIRADNIRIFKPLLYKSIFALTIMVAAFFAGVPVSLAALSAAAFLLFTRRIKPERVFTELDWSLLVFFTSLFVVTDVLGHYVINSLNNYSGSVPLTSSVGLFSIISIVLSNLISNVPAVLVMSPIVNSLIEPEKFWMLLALTSTFAGNLTLLGSVANLIVAESAKRHGVKLNFCEYLKAGVPITIITSLIGVLLLIAFYS